MAYRATQEYLLVAPFSGQNYCKAVTKLRKIYCFTSFFEEKVKKQCQKGCFMNRNTTRYILFLSEKQQ